MAEDLVTVSVAQGILCGKKTTAKAGNSYFSFEGVPYTQPPVGPLRFKIARPPLEWNGIRNALKVGPACPQCDGFLKFPYRGDEDCLYLNVYSPKLPDANEKKYPVMVWIHGGGFVVGSGDMLGAEYLVNEDVVIITINYRLGVFGFLSVEDERHPDNLGLKDQVAALRWIKDNVEAFGGDSNNITIFGESAGAACVHYHLLSPMSKGLFHKAVIQSGCALNPWASDFKPRELAFSLAKELGCRSSSIDDVLKCLRDAPARRLVENFQSLANRMGGHKGLRFAPTIERRVQAGEEVFLPEHPELMMRRGASDPIPCIIGLNSQEGILFLGLANILNDPSVLGVIGEHTESLLPNDVLASKVDTKVMVEKVKRFYFKNENISETSSREYVNFMSDTMFLRGIDSTAKILAANGHPVFLYHFDFDGKLNLLKNLIKANHLPGAAHMDELGYLFGTDFFDLPDEATADSREGLTRRRMVKLWTNFAKTGNPTPIIDQELSTIWPQFSIEKGEYLDISDTITVDKHLYKERIEFWKDM